MPDRWGDIGWTVQKAPTVLADSSNLAPWKIPADIETVNVVGEFHSISGGRATGYVEFEMVLDGPLLYGNAELTATKFTAFILQDGTLSVNIPATDGTKLAPAFTYKVSVVVNHRLVRTFTCSLPMATPVVDIHALAS